MHFCCGVDTRRGIYEGSNGCGQDGFQNVSLIRQFFASLMTRFYEADLGVDPDSPFVRDAANKLFRRSYWLDMNDRTLVMVMVSGIGAHLTNDEKRAHLTDLKRAHLIDQVCIQEISVDSGRLRA
jgi:hypothetical protein